MPAFVNERPQEEWTPEEVKLYQIYEQKVKELNEEREKLRKVRKICFIFKIVGEKFNISTKTYIF